MKLVFRQMMTRQAHRSIFVVHPIEGVRNLRAQRELIEQALLFVKNLKS